MSAEKQWAELVQLAEKAKRLSEATGEMPNITVVIAANRVIEAAVAWREARLLAWDVDSRKESVHEQEWQETQLAEDRAQRDFWVAVDAWQREQAAQPAEDPDDPDPGRAWCGRCGREMQHVRPGKWQCECEEGQR